MQLTLYRGSVPITLNQVKGYNECSYVSYAADAALARDIATTVAHIPHALSTVLVINDTTGGALCTELSKIHRLRVHVAYTPEWQKTHSITTRVAQGLQTTAIACEPIDPRKNMRNMRESIAQIVDQSDCVIIPELFYMARDHAKRVAKYSDLLGGRSVYTLPDMTTLRNKLFNYDCAVENVAPVGCRAIMPILRHTSSVPQVFKHPNVRFSTRDFLALPFLMSSSATTDQHDTFNVHEVHGEYPSANLHNLRLLIESGDISSLCARMCSGDGLTVCVGPENTQHHDVSVDDEYDDDDDDDDDDYEED